MNHPVKCFFKHPKSYAVILFTSIHVLVWLNAHAQGLTAQITEALRDRITFSEPSNQVVCMGEQLCGSRVLPLFYDLREFYPSWITDNGVRPIAHRLVQAIRAVEFDGLNPQDYHLGAIANLLKVVQAPGVKIASIPIKTLVELELLLSDAFLLFSYHLTSGRVNPETIQAEWTIKTHKKDLIGILQDLVEKGDVSSAVDVVQQQTRDYHRLQKALIRYRKIVENGGWPRIPKGPAMKRGTRGERVAVLESRLKVSGDLSGAAETDPDIFGDTLKKAVLDFQRRHGLVDDGIVGRATLSALNVPADDRLEQIKVNMERWRWLPRNFGNRYVLVNIADFQLSVVEEESQILKMRVVVGKDYRRTPVFVGRMTYMVINPFWNIPHKLAVEDFLPRIKKNSDYFKHHDIQVFESWKNAALRIDPESINWNMVDKNNFSHKLVQAPGPLNSLGRMKFMFPNKFSVYLHDTPARHLFNRTKRSFSSGCIRIEKPVDLAAYILAQDPKWQRREIQAAMDSLETQVVRISEPIPVLILYFTAWVDKHGTIHFRDDIYGRDKRLLEALRENPPAPQERQRISRQ